MNDRVKSLTITIAGAIIALGVLFRLIDMEVKYVFNKISKEKGEYARQVDVFSNRHGIEPFALLERILEENPELAKPRSIQAVPVLNERSQSPSGDNQ